MGYNAWLDSSVVKAIDYFQGIMATGYYWATKYAKFFALIGIIWSAFQLINSRIQIKQMLWDTLFKWMGFFLLMLFYPSLTFGFMEIANEIGAKAGGGKTVVLQGLKDLKQGIEKDLDWQKKMANDMTAELESALTGFHISAEFNENGNSSFNDYFDRVMLDIAKYDFSGTDKNDLDKAGKVLDKYMKKSKSYNKHMFSNMTLSSLDKVLVKRDADGNITENLIDSYVDLNLYLFDSKGKETAFLSSGALLRVAVLGANVMWEKNQLNYIDYKAAKKGEGLIKDFKGNIGDAIKYLVSNLMCMFCIIVLLGSVVFATIQYSMTILEYTIICSIGAIFLPLMLFDGTKDIPKKLIPVFISFMVKTIVITICLFFVYYLIIDSTIATIGDYAGMNWTTVVDILFTATLAYMLTQNAPKIAQTILTGQPQLSMGEFVTAAGTAGTTAIGMGKAGVWGARAGAKGTINTAGNLARGISAAKTASGETMTGTYSQLRNNGVSKENALKASKGAAFSAGLKGFGSGAIAQPTKELAARMKAKGNDFLHGHTQFTTPSRALGIGTWNGQASSTGGAGGTGTGGGSTNPHLTENVLNSHIGTAKQDGPQGKQNASVGNYMSGMAAAGQARGSAIGQETADKAAAKYMAQQNKVQQDSSLPDNLTGGERHTEE